MTTSPAEHLDVTPAIEEIASADIETSGERVARLLQQNGALAVVVLLALVAWLTLPSFSTFNNIGNVISRASFNMMVGVGLTMVIVTGGIDLSVGSMFALGGVTSAIGSHFGIVGALGLPIVVCGAIGLVQGTLIGRAKMAPFIVTLAGLLGVRGLVFLLTREGSDIKDVQDATTHRLFAAKPFHLDAPVFLALALVAIGYVVLQRTAFGQSVFAVGGNEDAARLMGVPVGRIKMIAYTFCAITAGLGGVATAAQSGSAQTTIGQGLELEVIAAIVIGGTLLTGGAGSMVGTMWGVLLLWVIRNVIVLSPLNDQLGSYGQQLVTAAFLAAVVVLQRFLATRAKL